MRKQIGHVLYTDPALAERVEDHVWIGRGFALVDAREFASGEREWIEDKLGPAQHLRYVVPLGCAEATFLPGISVVRTSLPRLRLAGITSDRMLYRQGCDEVHLLALDLLAANSACELAISANGSPFARRTVRLDAAGLAILSLVDLPAGSYSVQWAGAPEDEPPCEFTVAEYRLAPLVATLLQRELHGDPPRLSLMLGLETFGMPVSGRIRLELTDQDRPVDTTTVVAKAGRAYVSFTLSGTGPYAVNVQLIGDPSRTGKRADHRQQHTRPAADDLLPPRVRHCRLALAGTKCKGSPRHLPRRTRDRIQPRAIGASSTPARSGCAVAAVDALCIQVIDPCGSQSPDRSSPVAVVHRDGLAVDEMIEIEHQGPVALAGVAGFVNDEPWEGWAAVVAPSQLSPQIHVPQEAAPGQEVAIRVDAGQESGSVYLVVKDARLPASDTPGSRLAHAIKQGVEESLGDMEHQTPRRVSAIRDVVGILLLEGVIGNEQLAEAFEFASVKEIKPTEALLTLGYATAEEILTAIARYHGCECVDLSEIVLPPSVVELIPESVARENVVLPLGEKDGVLTVALSDPDDLDTLDKLRFILNRRIKVVLSPRDAIMEAINRHYDGLTVAESAFSMLTEFTDTAIDFTETIEEASGGEQLVGAAGMPIFDLTIAEAPADSVVDTLHRPLGDLKAKTQSAARPIDDAAVLFAGLLPVRNGQAETTIRLGTGLREYVAEAFVVTDPTSGLDWALADARFRPTKDPYAELELPRFVSQGDGAEGRLHVGAASGRLRASLTRNGQPVPLSLGNRPVALDEVLTVERETLSFLAVAGEYEAHVEDAASGKVDVAVGHVGVPGRIRCLQRPIRILQPGEKVSRDEEPQVFSLRVLAGLDQPFQALIEATGGYEHCCCEQTAAKLVAAAAMYVTSNGDGPRRNRAEEMILAGVRRERSMWLRGRGFKIYPDAPDQPDKWCGSLAARHLHYMQLLCNGDRGGMSDGLRQAVGDALEMGRDTAVAYKLDWPPSKPASAADAYAIVRFGSDESARTEALAWVRQRVNGVKPWHDAGYPAFGRVGIRESNAFGAAALLRAGNSADLPASIRLANRVVKELGPAGRLYSTIDSVAAMALMSEIQSTRILGLGGTVAVNGEKMPVADAARTTNEVRVVEALDERIAVEAAEIVEEDWANFAGGVGLHVSLEKNGRHSTQLATAEALELVVTLRDGYEPGDILWVCLPDALSRVFGGGQVKQFAVDFEGRDAVRVPLVTTGPTMDDSGKPAPHHFAICVRNMFQEERAGNPGLLEVTVSR